VQYFPLFLSLTDRAVLVVGGTEAAARKVRLLRQAGARITVVAPRAGTEISGLDADGALDWVRRGVVAGDVGGKALVIAATGSDAVDARVAEAAHAANIPVNVVDRADLSTFVTPAIVDRDPVTVAIGSGGAAPVLTRRIRARIERLLPNRLGALARFAESFRASVHANIGDETERRRFWERFFDGPVAAQVLGGNERGAREQMLSLVNRRSAGGPIGSVHIVGAGPGDPDLLTVRALRLLEDAEVVIYDKLIGPAILDLVRRDAERIYVGKDKGGHGTSQAEINDLIVAEARAGRRVVRLKGGDPFVFGRGGEEADHLRRHGIDAEILVTGHGKDGEPDLDWAALAGGHQTLVIYMGVSTAGAIGRRLIDNGLDPATPVAVIENGTRPEQKVVVGTLVETGRLIAHGDITGPAVIVVGDVVRAAGAGALTKVAGALPDYDRAIGAN
jgi:uroporphyrin-III C-methyltransferase/precorrin-2 dehydrogenase/sirohydrochlorin ferrochelatase